MTNLTDIISGGLWVGMALLIWFETNFAADWCRAIPLLGWITGVGKYLQAQKNHDEEVERGGKPIFANIREYIRVRHGRKFFGKLVTCAICSSVWASLCVVPFFSLAIWFPIAAVGILYYLVAAKLLTH